jgi:HK97 family phage major capsid protein
MLLEFLKPVGEYKVGDITDKFSDGVGQVLIQEGSAQVSSDMAQTRKLLLDDADRRHKALLEETRALLQGNRTATQGPPDGGGKLNSALQANLVDGKGEPVYEQGKKAFSDVLRCIHAVGAKGAPREIVEFASNRLRHVYSDERAEYKLNPQTGKMDSIVERRLDDGGIETVTRTGTDSLGGGATYGFTIKPNYLGDLFRIAREREVFASSCRAIPVVQGIETKYPALGQYSPPTVVNGIPQPAVFGGITLAYKNEVAARVESDSTTEEIDFKIVDLTGATSYSRDYIVDNFIAMDSIVTSLFGDAMAWEEDWITIHGNGSGQPQGYFASNALIQITRKNANKIASEDLGAMLSQLAGQCERSARWIAHRSTIPQLFILNNAAGTPVFQPNALIMQSDPLSIMATGSSDQVTFQSSGSLLGYPIFFTEKVPQLGTPGDLTLVCPNQYGLAERLGMEIGVSEHFYFSTDKIAYRFKKRHDGRSLWRAPYQDASAVATGGAAWLTSPFLMLK